MNRRPKFFTPALESALEATGLPWTLEPGSKHFHIRLAGKLAVVLPQGIKGSPSRILDAKNIRNVQRIAREVANG